MRSLKISLVTYTHDCAGLHRQLSEPDTRANANSLGRRRQRNLQLMKFIGPANAKTKQIGWLTALLAIPFLWSAKAGDQGANATREERAGTPIRIVDQYGHQAPSGNRNDGGEIFDVTVG